MTLICWFDFHFFQAHAPDYPAGQLEPEDVVQGTSGPDVSLLEIVNVDLESLAIGGSDGQTIAVDLLHCDSSAAN